MYGFSVDDRLRLAGPVQELICAFLILRITYSEKAIATRRTTFNEQSDYP